MTPRETLNKTVVAYLKTDVVKEKLAGMGMREMGDTPESFVARITADSKVFGEVAKKASIRLS